MGLGIPEIEAKRYEEKLRKGNYLIAVHTDENEDVDRAKHVFKTAGAEDINTVSEHRHRKFNMANENQMDQGPEVSPQARQKQSVAGRSAQSGRGSRLDRRHNGR